MVDKVFAHFKLSDKAQYGAFLSAHARVLPAAEEALEAGGIASLLPDWNERRRRHLLMEDLQTLHLPRPSSLSPAPLTSASALWGAVYVLEGSKLGGAMLAKAVPAEFPSRYLSPNGEKGGMKLFMDSLDRAEGIDVDAATSAARAVFELFYRAAELELEAAVS
jgi:heme oxygenase